MILESCLNLRFSKKRSWILLERVKSILLSYGGMFSQVCTTKSSGCSCSYPLESSVLCQNFGVCFSCQKWVSICSARSNGTVFSCWKKHSPCFQKYKVITPLSLINVAMFYPISTMSVSSYFLKWILYIWSLIHRLSVRGHLHLTSIYVIVIGLHSPLVLVAFSFHQQIFVGVTLF